MSWSRRLLAASAVGAGALVATTVAAGTAGAHGAMFGPPSRIAACYAEGPETPKSQVCKDLVADSGTQPLYDWNEVNIASANGQSQQIIPDGHLCSANRDKYRALDWARTDWPATSVAAGAKTFDFRVTAPHQGTMKLYLTKAGYDPAKPLKWSDLDLASPVAVYDTARTSDNGYYHVNVNLPQRTGRQLVYMVWQRSDSPEAFYGCSDLDFGSTTTAAAAPPAANTPSAPTQAQLDAGAARSTVSHHGHGGDLTAAEAVVASSGTVAVDRPGQDNLLLGLAGAGLLAATASGAYLARRMRGTAVSA
ncbi:lytic polysaccharide monooxygenase auxiliary activity family 9 protein [Kitasatospora cineracea]|uniref:Putative carbohydrate-binding protein with CBM5 and CBM33 domain n=1 Tax=Kitasatospora cineracea TaxID=88074 RepID=A0A8G1XFM0_9ACTN|nr:lytic polysaccharide monooxygenase [Kitasatospora cineracea]ROR46626.1 putative carbohydrate-binding protein with CBM5 and CBM33 domain [Kitasatospora cineracea]